jgi:hypothetical protein
MLLPIVLKAGLSRAKAPRTPRFGIIFLCGPCVFAGDIAGFGRGFAALWERLEELYEEATYDS